MKQKTNDLIHKMNFQLKSVLSLKLLIQFWQKTIQKDKALGRLYSNELEKELGETPELLEPIYDLSLLEEHRDLIDLLMSAVFPAATGDKEIAAAFIPFSANSIYTTPAYQEHYHFIESLKQSSKPTDEEKMKLVVMLSAYKAILDKFYGITLDFEFPWILSIPDSKTGLEKHYNKQVDSRFIEIKNLKPIKPISENDKKRLHDNITNLEVWKEIIPPEDFEFQGFLVYKVSDVSDNELLSQLKYELSKKDVLSSESHFKILEHKMRSLMKLPDLRMGLSGLMAEKNLVQNCGHQIGHSFFLNLTKQYCPVDFQKSTYGKVIHSRKPLIVPDISKYSKKTSIEKQVLQHGIRNVALFPLVFNDHLIGLVELVSPNPGEINGINTLKLESLMPLFVMAIKRNLEELDNRIQGIIKEECTAIHPSVEWRFRDAAFNLIQKETANQASEMEPIVFDEVYSLYGLSDIRGSSTSRNKVIQEDLIDHLKLAKDVLIQSKKTNPLLILDELIYRTESYQSRISKGLNSDEEGKVLDFLHREIEPLFDHFKELGKNVVKKINAYKKALNPQLGFVYNKRKDFEESVMRINEMIATYIEEEEQKAQKMFPHYFEKYKTDGVDYNVYIGASLAQDKHFNMIYLKNMRLWQLMLMCGIVNKSSALKEELKMPLDTAHLILIQSTPISIQFRFDEKRFDVNGAYNVKYEIVKKRIDKAVIKGTGERLTQPGKIAIVYSQTKDAYEYREYLEYLHHSGYITGETEDVQLEDLQGLQGLRALRITVNIEQKQNSDEIIPENVEEAIREMSEKALK